MTHFSPSLVPSPRPRLLDLADVSVAEPRHADVLTYHSTAQRWLAMPSSGGGGATTLAELTDVNLTGLTDQDRLKYDAATQKWVRTASAGGGTFADLDDVNVATAADQDSLKYDAATQKWIPWPFVYISFMDPAVSGFSDMALLQYAPDGRVIPAGYKVYSALDPTTSLYLTNNATTTLSATAFNAVVVGCGDLRSHNSTVNISASPNYYPGPGNTHVGTESALPVTVIGKDNVTCIGTQNSLGVVGEYVTTLSGSTIVGAANNLGVNDPTVAQMRYTTILGSDNACGTIASSTIVGNLNELGASTVTDNFDRRGLIALGNGNVSSGIDGLLLGVSDDCVQAPTSPDIEGRLRVNLNGQRYDLPLYHFLNFSNGFAQNTNPLKTWSGLFGNIYIDTLGSLAPSGVWTNCAIDAGYFAVSNPGFWNASTPTAFTPVYDGMYQVQVRTPWTSSPLGYRKIGINVDSGSGPMPAPYILGHTGNDDPGGTEPTVCVAFGTFYMGPGVTLTIQVKQNCGADLGFIGGAEFAQASFTYLGRVVNNP